MLEKRSPGTISLAIIICTISLSFGLKCELKGLVDGRVQCIFHDRGTNAASGTKVETLYIVEEIKRRQTPPEEEKQQKYSTGLDLNATFALLPDEEKFKKRVGEVIPDTRWCGEAFGSMDLSYEDLASFTETQTCCHKHESCEDVLEPKRNAYDLTNAGVLPRYHCSCEMDFLKCLRRVNSRAGNKIGFTYFTVFGPQCFKEDFPIVECVRNKGGRCLVHTFDRNLKKKYQWFDVPLY